MIYRPFSGIFLRAASCVGLRDKERQRAKERIEWQSTSKCAIRPIVWLLPK